MITVDYSGKQIKVTLGFVSRILGIDKLPLKVDIIKKVSGESWWSTKIGDAMWASFPDNEINDVVITDKEEKLVYKYEWNVLEHGSIFYKSLYYYCKKLISENKRPKGLVIGSHDGEFGEWVPVSLDNLSDIVLVEGSEKQYEKLKENFKHSNHKMMREIITPNGGVVEFFEGGQGYTNSVVERVIRNWETEEISSSQKNSLSINQLIKDNFPDGLDWIHTDIEGLDMKVIMAIEDKLLPNFIMFEDNNSSQDEKDEIVNYLNSKGYLTYSEKGMCMANKN